MVFRPFVELPDADFEQGRHLVDERARAAGAASVHARVVQPAEKEELGVLPSQLDHYVRAGREALGRKPGGVHFLHKGQPRALGKAQPRAAAEGNGRPVHIREQLAYAREHAGQGIGDLAVMPPVLRMYHIVLVVQHHRFHGGGTHVNSQTQCFLLPVLCFCIFLSVCAVRTDVFYSIILKIFEV